MCGVLCMQAEADLRVAQAEFDRQAEITKLLLEGIASTHVSTQGTPQGRQGWIGYSVCI